MVTSPANSYPPFREGIKMPRRDDFGCRDSNQSVFKHFPLWKVAVYSDMGTAGIPQVGGRSAARQTSLGHPCPEGDR